MLHELVAKILPEAVKDKLPISLKRHFPKITESLQEFITLLEQNESLSVTAIPNITPYLLRFSRYKNMFISQTAEGRPIHYVETYGLRLKQDWVQKTFLTAIDRLSTIRASLPYVDIQLIDRKRGQLSLEDFEEIHLIANIKGLRPFN